MLYKFLNKQLSSLFLLYPLFPEKGGAGVIKASFLRFLSTESTDWLPPKTLDM